MSFCKNCGTQLKEGAVFCGECGTPVGSIKTENSTPTASQPVAATAPKKPMTKKQKWSIISVCIAVVLIFAAYKVGATLMSKDRLINKFQTALVNKDSHEVANLLSTDDKKLKITDASVKGLMKYFDKHPDEINSLVKTLKDEAKMYDNSNGDKIPFSDDNQIMTLEKDGNFLVYDKYAIKIQSVYLNLSTNYKNTELYVDGKKIGKATKQDFEKTYGPFVPGIHSLEAKLKTSFIDLNKKKSILLGGNGTKQDEDIVLDGQDVTIHLPIDQDAVDKAELFINGKDTGLNLMKQNTFGPVLTDGSMTYSVEVNLPFGKIKTPEQPIDTDEIDANLMTDDLNQTLMDTSVLNAKEWMQAYTSGDMSKFTTATDDYKSTVQSQYEDGKNTNYAYQGSYLGSTFNLGSTTLYYEDGQWKSEVSVEEEYNSSFYDPTYESPVLEDNNEDWVYTLIYDTNQKKWLVDNRSSSYGLDSDNTKEVKNDNPTVYTSAWAGSAVANSSN